MISEAPSSEPREWQAPLASGIHAPAIADELERLEQSVLAGQRITPEEALYLHDHADLPTLGRRPPSPAQPPGSTFSMSVAGPGAMPCICRSAVYR